MTKKKLDEEKLSAKEIARRRDEVVRTMLATPPQPKAPAKPKK